MCKQMIGGGRKLHWNIENINGYDYNQTFTNK